MRICTRLAPALPGVQQSPDPGSNLASLYIRKMPDALRMGFSKRLALFLPGTGSYSLSIQNILLSNNPVFNYNCSGNHVWQCLRSVARAL